MESQKDQIFQKLESVRDLPTLPLIIEKLGAAIRDPNTNAESIAGIIEDDPAMMTKILRVVNSVLYGAREPINSLPLAVARMGMNAINNIAMSTSVFSTFKKTEQSDFDRVEFWRHCICTGIAAEVIYRRCRENLSQNYSKDLIHLSGLLHDIGKIILETNFRDEFMATIKACSERHIPLFQVELETLGTDHAQIGARLGERWKLSEPLIQTIRWHHEPDNADSTCNELVMLVHTANYICNLEKIGDSGDAVAPAFFRSVWKRLDLEVTSITDVVDEVKEESKKSEVLLSLMED